MFRLVKFFGMDDLSMISDGTWKEKSYISATRYIILAFLYIAWISGKGRIFQGCCMVWGSRYSFMKCRKYFCIMYFGIIISIC